MPANRWASDRSTSAPYVWTKYDHATAIAAALSYMTIQQQDSAGLAIFDEDLKHYFKPSNSPGQWKIITHELSSTPQLKKTSTGPHPRSACRETSSTQPDRDPERFLR